MNLLNRVILREMRIGIIDKLKEMKTKTEEHTTCDGCQMFQDCGCMLDVSICPDCWEHDMWTPKRQTIEMRGLFKDILWGINKVFLFRKEEIGFSRWFEIGCGIIAWMNIILMICIIIF